ncbi:helix-turn-helix domain-containing protein [Streptomyces sp. NBC_01190]|uniref:helix-turn-helix domain-containing protein n=1 Tax=Streptomyces sp. NBC_01190 TaxID=2903767 RepID=UPI003869D56E|nr:helix-turn-helix domain-containing protein [Streptomyces sp. NBC_01190]
MDTSAEGHQPTDPKSMRALAHPTRLRLLAELRIRGPQTVGLLSDILGEPVGGVSYHLGQLATHHLVEEVPELARDRRERWWKAAHPRTVLGPADGADDPQRAEASQALRHAIIQRYLDLLERYLDSESSLGKRWANNAVSSDATLHLTPEQLGELKGELEEVAARWEERGNRDTPGTQPVVLMYHAFRRPQ